ncbi:ATP-binding cassette domain-containing protein [Mesobacillus subterraneus]|uniref:ABC transporter ATP-binding protein n=1 Tax=Mesobacillus subterraneus TaxID=285983 RepID=UPI00203B75D9|nr:ATP-binding cassette domain-containing protein [Mesobacillus subterraneus]MCM3664861.1 ATP-binding cassette domain-containing protein [Mesobacillus subterraneus]MCM3681950.1 ATP-binding cassette domain-containing protein [Mesobacillus subterraneus]
MSQFALEVKSLTKRIGKKTIVDDVSFQVERGEIFGLLGPNGAGKTTIIRMIVSLINRTGGTVLVNGQDLDESFTQAMNELGAIVENPEFYKYLSGYKNLKHYARMALTDITEERIEEVTELVGLENAIHDKVRTYSLGMRQRLGVAQTILHKPSILILDEPTNGLDPQGIREFRDYLRLLASQGTSVLVSSHLLSEMQLMCDRFAIIEQGKLVHISTMNENETEETKVTRSVEMEVSNASHAAKLLKEKMPEVKVTSIKDSRLILSVEKETIPVINKLLVLNDIDVFEILNVKATLEDRFLEITNKDKKEQTV